MTNAEWLGTIIPEVDSGVKSAIMADRGITPSGAYTGIAEKTQLAKADVYMEALLMPEIQEGSLRIKYSSSSLKSEANRIYLMYGDARYDSGQPLIKRVKL